MISLRQIRLGLLLLVFVLSACAAPVTTGNTTQTPLPGVTESAAVEKTPVPAVSTLDVDPADLRGTQINVWHPWFGTEAGLFESQVAKFNSENEWGIVVNVQDKGNFSELFSQTSAALEDRSNPQVVVALPEQAFTWGDKVIDLNPYVSDPQYGLGADDVLDFPPAVWDQENLDGKRFGVPAERTARFLLYNQTWARELGFPSPPATSADFEQQACAANKALAADADPTNNALGGWIIDTDPMTPLSWLLAFGGGAQEEDSYRFLTPGNIAAFKFVKNLQTKGCAWVPSQDLSVYDRFAGRQALFATASLDELSDQARAFLAAGSRDEWTVLPFPGEKQTAFTLYGSSFVMLDSDDVNRLASWLFMRWMLSPDNQANWVKSTGLFPLRSSEMNLLADYSAEHPQWAAAVKLLPEGRRSPQLASWRIVRTMLGDGFRDMFDTIRHPDLTEGQVPLILKQMDATVTDLKQ
jgi:ABC-type glycerol-3-phosphate transport system substrate-binding protein